MPWLVLLISLGAASLTGETRAAALVPFGSVWKYLDDGSNQSNAWRAVEYEDDGWASGPAQLGYGDGDEATEVSYGTNASAKFITTYFRLTFDVPELSGLTNLVLNLIRDDGAIVYLNGVEVFRSGMPATAVTYTTRATDNAENTAVGTNLSPTLLVLGQNLIAVEVHQDSQSSSDISFDLELTDGRSDSPVISITSPANNAAVHGPGNLTVIVNAIDPNGAVTNVQLFSGNHLIGTKSAPPFTFVWSNMPSGTHILSATARDNDGLLAKSPTVRIVVGPGSAANLTLVPAGSAWRYLDDGSDQGTAWQSTNFNHSGWSNGVAQLGYGDNDEATVVRFGPSPTNKHITTYFRREFLVADAAAVNPLVLRLLRDDGAVVYLNGIEVFRDNLPAGGIDYQTRAVASLSGTDEEIFVRTNISSSALHNGTNVLAVEIHQSSPTSGDISFDLELNGTDLPAVVRGPWLQSVSWSNGIVKWRTDTSVAGRVRFGTNPASLNFTVNGASAVDHRLDLTNLAPGTKYYYSVGTTGTVLLAGADYCFTTPPLPGTRQPMRFWALGDSGTANVNQFNVRDAFYRMNGTNRLDAVLLLGDNAYNSGQDAEFQVGLFDAYPTVLRNTPLWPTIGNHETAQSSSPAATIPYYQIFSLPRNGEAGGLASGTEDYYSFDIGNIHFVCLDAMTSSRSPTGAMALWLENDLAATAQDWLIAFWHHPPYTKGSHNSDSETVLIEMRQNMLPILEAHGVDLVLCGHSHAYERTHLLNGHYGSSGTITPAMKLNTGGGRPEGAGAYVKSAGLPAHQGAIYVVTGSAGQVSGGSLNHSAMFLSLNRLGSLYFEVSTNRLDAVFLRDNGTTNDTFTIIKGNSITVADASVTEPDTNSVHATFTLTLTQTSTVPVSVSYATASETAWSGLDFNPLAGSITFAPGVRTQYVNVSVAGDLLVEADETFALNFSGTPLLTRALARGTILNNDTTNGVSAPILSGLSHSNQTVTLRWRTQSGVNYRVEYKDNLNAAQWELWPQVINGDGNFQSIQAATTNAQRFFRVRVE